LRFESLISAAFDVPENLGKVIEVSSTLGLTMQMFVSMVKQYVGASPRRREASYLRLSEISEALLQKVQLPDQAKPIKDMMSDLYYELFMLTRDVQGDVHVCMNYLSKAIDLSQGENWVYHFEMSLFIKQVIFLLLVNSCRPTKCVRMLPSS
jgi:hypothetical protein